MWRTIASAPSGPDLELAVIDKDGPHVLVFPCRRIAGGWMNAMNRERLDVRPTHWRPWPAGGEAASGAPGEPQILAARDGGEPSSDS